MREQVQQLRDKSVKDASDICDSLVSRWREVSLDGAILSFGSGFFNARYRVEREVAAQCFSDPEAVEAFGLG